MKEHKLQIFKKLISEMKTDELRELIIFCQENPYLNNRPLYEANKEIRKRNEIFTA